MREVAVWGRVVVGAACITIAYSGCVVMFSNAGDEVA